jgi:hypothetical protein
VLPVTVGRDGVVQLVSFCTASSAQDVCIIDERVVEKHVLGVGNGVVPWKWWRRSRCGPCISHPMCRSWPPRSRTWCCTLAPGRTVRPPRAPSSSPNARAAPRSSTAATVWERWGRNRVSLANPTTTRPPRASLSTAPWLKPATLPAATSLLNVGMGWARVSSLRRHSAHLPLLRRL